MPHDIVVRDATPSDFDAIAGIAVAAYQASGQLSGPEVIYADELADVATRAAGGQLLVATDPQGEVLGSVLFVLPGSPYTEAAEPGEAEFRMLSVDPSAQRRGVGQALAEACVARAQAVGATAVVIHTRDFVTVAHRLYERLGFVRVPEHDWEPIDGVRLLRMRLDLTAPA